MAYTNNARSFTSVANTNAEKNKNNNSTIGMNAAFGSNSIGNAWGSSNIWGAGGISNTNTLAAAAAARENSMSRDAAIAKASNGIEGKTGSGSLVDSSVCDEYTTRPAWGTKRSSNSIPQAARYSENTLSQQRGSSNAGLSQPSMNLNTSGMSYPSRPAVNLNSTAPAQARPSFTSSYPSGPSGRGENVPFNVYTKFNRPDDPSIKKQDSAVGPWVDSTTASPTDERRPQFPTHYSNSRTPSMPNSRDGPDHQSSRLADQSHSWNIPDYGRPSQQRVSPESSRAPSISSRNEAAYSNFLQSNADQMAMQFGQLKFNPESRPSTSYRSSFADGPLNGNEIAPLHRGSVQYSRSGDVEEIDRSSRNNSTHNDHRNSQQSNGYSSYSTPSYAERALQSGGPFEFRPGQPYQGNAIASRTYDVAGGARQSQDWQNYPNGALVPSRRSPGLPDQQAYLNPQFQQMMAAQLRHPYATLYNPYMQNVMQLHHASPYLGMLPMMNMNATMDPLPISRDTPAGEGFQSALMYEFKSNTKSKRYELRDIYEHIAEFSGDQHGSRFIQTKLETANSDEKERVFREIQENAVQLMTDVFGNYVIQKFFEHGDQTHKKILANKMRGQVLQLSMQMYGCRVVQKALDHVLVDQQAVLIGELENHVTKCVKDQNGNHVIQKAIERCPAATIEFIIAAFRGQVHQLSIHAYGCRVIQRCLEKCDLPSKAMIMSELLDGIPTMISDQYGNYVVQHIVTHDDGEARCRVLRVVAGGLEGYSKHKYASNVVEKCLERADDAWRRNVVLTLAKAQQSPRRPDMLTGRGENEGVMVNMIKDNFGNYVIQKLLDTLCRDDYFLFLETLQPAMAIAKRTGCGKQVQSIDQKMHRFDDFQNGVPPGPHKGVVSYVRPQYQIPMSMNMPTQQQPQYVSNYNSAATTPPPLTADTQSLQSSRAPSVNGDAIEGASSASRKGSQQSNDFYHR